MTKKPKKPTPKQSAKTPAYPRKKPAQSPALPRRDYPRLDGAPLTPFAPVEKDEKETE